MKEYDIFVPLSYNDGTSIEAFKLQRIQARLLDHFEGLTYFPQPNEGVWRFGEVVYRDAVVIYRVITRDAVASRRFLEIFKTDLKRDLQQLEVLTVEREIGLI